MPGIVRVGDIGSNHGPFIPSPAIQGSSDVFANGRGVHRTGDALLAHPAPGVPPHPRSAGQGSSNVFVNGKPVMRNGDPISCGGTYITSSSDVMAN